MDCMQCDGKGRVTLALVADNSENDDQFVAHIMCPWCKGLGVLDTDSVIGSLRESNFETKNERPQHLVTAEMFFTEHLRQLIHLLQMSRGLPFIVYQAWGAQLAEIELSQPEHGLQVLNEVISHFWELKKELSSGDLLSDSATPRSVVLNQELGEIKRQLDWLEVILQFLNHHAVQSIIASA